MYVCSVAHPLQPPLSMISAVVNCAQQTKLEMKFISFLTALKWLESFLKDRSQSVLIDNTLSDSLKVKFGVPQGSVLGVKLFNIYIQSLFKTIKKCGFCTSGYADDNNAYQSFALHFQYDLITILLPALMTEINKWMNRHFLKINPDKTEIIVFLPYK